jgi:multicomponent Na+:H+ antiporter subunit B
VFDIGVYLTVWGALAGYALSLLALGEADEGGHATEEGQA